MKLDDIINAATPGPWDARFFGHRSPYVDIVDGNDSPISFLDYNGGNIRVSADARFIATLDPEHARLMEDERKWARKVLDAADRKDALAYGVARVQHRVAWQVLDAYREERGIGSE